MRGWSPSAAAIRGDLPHLPDLLADLDRHRITLTPQQQHQLGAGPHNRPVRPARYEAPESGTTRRDPPRRA